MAANGNSGNGNTSTGQSAASAQAAAAAGNAAASNAATSAANGESAAKGQAASNNATNSAGLMGSLMGFANNITGNVGETYGGSGDSGSKSDDGFWAKYEQHLDALRHKFTSKEQRVAIRNILPADIVKKGDEVYTEARKNGKTEAEAQYESRQTVRKHHDFHDVLEKNSPFSVVGPIDSFEGKNTGPTYDPSVSGRANTNPTIAKGSSEMGPSAPAAPATPATTPAANNTPGGSLGGETGGIAGSSTETAAPSFSETLGGATNTGITNRGGTVANGGGTSVTDSGTGGSISSSITPPSRDESSIGLGVYNTDRANYDQDNWNRGMEAESSSLVSDEECKAFAKRAFMENSEPFKKVRVTIIKKC